MKIDKVVDGGVTTLRLDGEIDLHASPVLRKQLLECVNGKAGTLLLDFSNVSYIDSSGLATLIEYVRESASYSGRLALFGLQAKVRTIFDLVRLNELFTITGSAAEALKAVGKK